MLSIKPYVQNKAPAISTKLKQLPPEEIAVAAQRYKSAKDADRHDRNRGIRDMRMYLSLDYDAWPNELIESLLAEGRDPKTYALAQKYVKIVAGNYIMNSFDSKYIDREDDKRDVSSLLYKANRIHYVDKNHMNYAWSRNVCLENGCIYRGIEEIVIRRSDKEPGGRIGFEPVRFDLWTGDPNNLSDRISRDARECFKEFYLDEDEMAMWFPDKEGDIQTKFGELKSGSQVKLGEFEETSIGQFQKDDTNTLGGKQLVIEWYHLEYEKKIVVYDALNDLYLPDTGTKIGTEEDFVKKQLWAASKGYMLMPEFLETKEWRVPVLYCTTYVPSIGLLLDHRQDERQIGFLPFYVWSYTMKHGKTIGLIDYAYELNVDINKREAAKTKQITSSPVGGKTLIHPMLYGRNIKKIQAGVTTANDPAAPILADESCPPQLMESMFKIVPGAQINQGFFQDESFKMAMMNEILNVPPALQGRTERTGESGLHLGRKVIEGTIAHQLPMSTIVQHEKDKAEDWINLAAKIYGGRNENERVANYGRVFKSGAGESLEINKFVGIDENGQDIVEDDFSTLSSVDVIISPAKENDYQRQARMETNAMALNTLKPSDSNGVVIAAFYSDWVNSMPFDSDEQRTMSKAAVKKYYDIENFKANMLLTQLQTSAAMGQPGVGGGESGNMPIPNIPAQTQSPIGAQRQPLQNQRLSMIPPKPGE